MTRPWCDLSDRDRREVLAWLDTRIALFGPQSRFGRHLAVVRDTLRELDDGGYDRDDVQQALEDEEEIAEEEGAL